MHYRLVPEHSEAVFVGVFNSEVPRGASNDEMTPSEKEQLYTGSVMTLRTSPGSWGPFFHEWWHALDYKLAPEPRQFASEDESLNHQVGQVLSNLYTFFM